MGGKIKKTREINKRKSLQSIKDFSIKKVFYYIVNLFTFNTLNSQLVFLALACICLLTVTNFNKLTTLVILVVSILTLFYVAFKNFVFQVGKDSFVGRIGLVYFPLITLIYTIAFSSLIEKNPKVTIPILVIILICTLAFLSFSLTNATIVIQMKELKVLYTVFCFILSLFMVYFSFGFALLYSTNRDNAEVFINAPSSSASEILIFLTSYGQSKITEIPELVYENREMALGVATVKTETLLIHLIGIIFIAMFTSVSLSYLARIIFEKDSRRNK